LVSRSLDGRDLDYEFWTRWRRARAGCVCEVGRILQGDYEVARESAGPLFALTLFLNADYTDQPDENRIRILRSIFLFVFFFV
jgi:hypothetical protein